MFVDAAAKGDVLESYQRPYKDANLVACSYVQPFRNNLHDMNVSDLSGVHKCRMQPYSNRSHSVACRHVVC